MKYLIACGLAANAAFVTVLIAKPEWIGRGRTIVESKLTAAAPAWLEQAIAQPVPVYSLDDEIATNFAPWAPLPTASADDGRRVVDTSRYSTLQAAANDLRDGDRLRIAAGIYEQALVLRASRVIVEGSGHVVLDGKAAEGKAAIVNKGSFNTIRNLECRNISVRDRNGACVRHEGEGLRLEHVYFHDSQQGVLTGKQAGTVELIDSRLERLGQDGRAHGIYINGGELTVRDSLVLASRSEGHEIKSRAARTLIDRSVIASFSAGDSRLIDVSNGGVLIVRDSVLEKGPGSVNQDLIGYGLEGIEHEDNRIALTGNLILLERTGANVLVHMRNPARAVLEARNNTVIAAADPELPGLNLYFESREQAGLPAYPGLPAADAL